MGDIKHTDGTCNVCNRLMLEMPFMMMTEGRSEPILMTAREACEVNELAKDFEENGIGIP